jgi:hypothetical protein
VTAIQSQLPALVDAVQEQLELAVTLTTPDPPSLPKSWLVGEIEIEGQKFSWLKLAIILIGPLMMMVTGFCVPVRPPDQPVKI